MSRGRDARLIEAIFGPVVKETDLRYTPRATVEALFDSDPPPEGRLLDPCAGDGAILREADHRGGYDCAACEIREEERLRLEDICGPHSVKIGDWRKIAPGIGPAVSAPDLPPQALSIVTNPPFSVAREIAEACFIVRPDYLALLLRCNTLGSNPWRSFWRAHQPTRIRLVERPSFPKPGQTEAEAEAEGTDMSDYFWSIWAAGEPPLNLKPI